MEEGQSTYRVVVPEANAHLPAQQFSQLIGAPLRCVRSFVLDKDKPELPAPGTNGDLQKHVPCAK